jgi:hypothetical protein
VEVSREQTSRRISGGSDWKGSKRAALGAHGRGLSLVNGSNGELRTDIDEGSATSHYECIKNAEQIKIGGKS